MWYIACVDALTRINGLLDRTDEETVGTSMRIPAALRDAAALAVSELAVAASTTALTTDALRGRLEAIVVEAALEMHYAQYPLARPDLAELAVAAAELDGNPLAATPELIRAAAIAILERHPGADADDVLLWAEARASSAA
jgi:hypothetical protein